MQPEQKLSLLMDGQKNGISDACSKYHISRTLYYRWLKRYKTIGVLGLGKMTKHFVPPNKTAPAVIEILMTLIKKYPLYGPRALKYMLDDLNYEISESAVYNILRSHGLSTKKQRQLFAKKRDTPTKRLLPSFSQLSSGECWIFWTTYVGNFQNIGDLYLYTYLDYKSRIACSRLYTTLSIAHFENLLTAVAIPVAQTLKFDTKYLYLSQNDDLCGKKHEIFVAHIEKVLLNNNFDATLFTQIDAKDVAEINLLISDYNHVALGALLQFIQEGHLLEEIRLKFQNEIRNYNLNHKSTYGENTYTPVEYHAKTKHLELILPLWAYIDRDY